MDLSGTLMKIVEELYKGNRNRRLAVDASDRLVGQVYQCVENFVMIYQSLTARPSADPTAIISAYHDLVNAIEEVKRDKVLVKCIEKGREPLNYYVPPGGHSTHSDNRLPASNELVERDLGRALWHIGNSARRVLESFEIPVVTGPGLSANPLSDIREVAGYFRATWRRLAPLSVERKYFGP